MTKKTGKQYSMYEQLKMRLAIKTRLKSFNSNWKNTVLVDRDNVHKLV